MKANDSEENSFKYSTPSCALRILMSSVSRMKHKIMIKTRLMDFSKIQIFAFWNKNNERTVLATDSGGIISVYE